jgi:hypothetical protein
MRAGTNVGHDVKCTLYSYSILKKLCMSTSFDEGALCEI